MFDPKQAPPPLASLSMSELMKKRAEIEHALEQAETHWLSASEALERLAA
jgi:ATP-binding cassette subfamily F protein 3